MFPAALFQLASDERGGAPACEALSCLVQSALRRHVLCEKLHLVSEYAAIRENQVFGAIRHVRQIQEFHARHFGRAIALALITRPARGYDVHPGIFAAARKRNHVIARELRCGQITAAKRTQITIPVK
jgi:hypothetical protein